MKAILTVPHEFDMLVQSGHIQGLACSEKGIYPSHQTGLAKIGWDGKLVKHIEVPGHLGGIAFADGRICGAMKPTGAIPTWIDQVKSRGIDVDMGMFSEGA